MPRRNHAVRLGNSASVFRRSRLTPQTHGIVLQSPSFVLARACVHFATRACADAHEGDPANNETNVTTAQTIPPVCEGLPADNEAWRSEREGGAVVRGVSRFENEARTRGRKALRGARSTGLSKTKRAPCATRSPSSKVGLAIVYETSAAAAKASPSASRAFGFATKASAGDAHASAVDTEAMAPDFHLALAQRRIGVWLPGLCLVGPY